MHATADALADFAARHLGFTAAMADDGFVSLTREDAGFNLVFLRTGLGTFKPASIAGDAGQGTLVAFVVDDIELARGGPSYMIDTLRIMRDRVDGVTEVINVAEAENAIDAAP